ncbi:hypothetical protein D3C71_1368700 [compost metagenome]
MFGVTGCPAAGGEEEKLETFGGHRVFVLFVDGLYQSYGSFRPHGAAAAVRQRIQRGRHVDSAGVHGIPGRTAAAAAAGRLCLQEAAASCKRVGDRRFLYRHRAASSVVRNYNGCRGCRRPGRHYRCRDRRIDPAGDQRKCGACDEQAGGRLRPRLAVISAAGRSAYHGRQMESGLVRRRRIRRIAVGVYPLFALWGSGAAVSAFFRKSGEKSSRTGREDGGKREQTVSFPHASVCSVWSNGYRP